jgi:hypothetical protein
MCELAVAALAELAVKKANLKDNFFQNGRPTQLTTALAGGLSGAGLGGAGSYLVGTEPGRSISGAWLKTLIDKLSRNT